MIDGALVELLRTHASVGNRVYSGAEVVEVVTRQLPMLVYTYIDGTRLYSDHGNAGLVKGRYQLDVFAIKPSDARQILTTVRIALDGFKGQVDGTKIDRIYFPDDSRMQKPVQPVGQSATAAHYAQDLLVDFREQVII